MAAVYIKVFSGDKLTHCGACVQWSRDCFLPPLSGVNVMGNVFTTLHSYTGYGVSIPEMVCIGNSGGISWSDIIIHVTSQCSFLNRPTDLTYCLTCAPCWGNQQFTLCLSTVCDLKRHSINSCWCKQNSPQRVRHKLHSDKADYPRRLWYISLKVKSKAIPVTSHGDL
jgi:hypothetical protein